MSFTLTGTDNDGFRHRYSIKKDKRFKKDFLKFMEMLEFDPKDVERIFFSGFEDEEGGWNSVELDIKELEDCIRHFQNKKYDVDVFFGKKKVIILVRTKKRIPIVDYLQNKADWIKPLEVEKIQEENKEKILVKAQKVKSKNK